jgi:hypothetical protein
VTTLTLIGKPDCHLCEVAREIVDVVVAETPEDHVVVEEFSILDDPALYALWWEKIPVILIDGEIHAHWRVSPQRLRSALDAADESTADSAVGALEEGERYFSISTTSAPGALVLIDSMPFRALALDEYP